MVTKDEQVKIVSHQLKELELSIYELSIKKRVALAAGDEKLDKVATDALIKLEKAKDEYNKILTELGG